MNRSLWNVFWPIVLTFLGGRVVLQTDLVMVSRLGAAATAAFGIPVRIMLIDAIVAFALGPVVSILVAEQISVEGRARVVQQAMSLAMILGSILAGLGLLVYPKIAACVTTDPRVLPLARDAVFWLTLAIPIRMADFVAGMALHGLGRGKLVTPIKLTEVATNAALDWLLIFKLGFGFKGCYLSTFAASALSAAWSAATLRRQLQLQRLWVVPDRRWVVETSAKTGAELGRLVSERMVAFLLLWLFAQGADAVPRLSAFSVGDAFQMLIFMPLIALMRASAITLSAQDADRSLPERYGLLRSLAWRGALFCAFFGAVVAAFGGRIGWFLYRLEPQAMAWWRPMTILLVLWIPLRYLDALQRGAWQSMKLFKPITLYEMTVNWLFLLPAVSLALHRNNPWLTWGAIAASELVVAALLLRAAVTRRAHAPLVKAASAVAGVLFAISLLGGPAHADEGMWTLDHLPTGQLKKRYGFVPTQAWIEHVRLSSVRFNDGGSGGVRLLEWVGPDKSSCRSWAASEDVGAGARSCPRWLLRAHPKRGAKMPRS